MNGLTCSWGAALALLVTGFAPVSFAQTESGSAPSTEFSLSASAPTAPATADNGTTTGDPAEEQDERRGWPRWRDSLFLWEHSAETETLGVGRDVQTRNPTYEMSFRLAPRYYFIDRSERELSLRGDVALIREFTNSDTTTDRGEWTFTDAELWLLLEEQLHEAPGMKTDLVVRLPSIRLPTSEASYSSGKILGLGAGVGIDQRVPLAGDDAPLFSGTLLRPRLGYTYQFVQTTVPTNDAIDRVRLSPAGRSLPSDQLSGTAFPQHEINLSLRAETDVFENFGLVTELGARYARRYALADREAICGVVDTGCITVDTSQDAPRWGVSTLFGVEVSYLFSDMVLLALGYSNLAGQLGADGQRQSVLYSPDARFTLSAAVVLDALYAGVTGRPSRAAASTVGAPAAF